VAAGFVWESSPTMAKEQERDGALIWMLPDENLLAVLEKLTDRWDRQSWCAVCKKFRHLEAVSRKYVHLMRSEILEPVLRRHHHVEHLDLSSCMNVKDSCLATVAKFTSQRLLSIKLIRTKGFGAVGVRSLVECASLKEVDLSFCNQVGDKEVIALSELQHLQKLNLTQCRHVTDVGLSALSNCKELATLWLKYCSGIGDVGIQNVATGCRQLRNMELSFTEVIWLACILVLKGLDPSFWK